MTVPENMTLKATVDQTDIEKLSGQRTATWSDRFAWIARILLLLALLSSPWMLGSVQDWSQFWLSLALLIALGLWWFETALNKRSTQVIPYIAIPMIIGIGIAIVQVIPLGDGSFLLGRQTEIYENYTAVGAQENAVSPRISLNSEGTYKHLRLLVLALAALLLGCRYFRTKSHLLILLTAMTANGVAIAFFGMIQKLTWNGMLFWSIPLTQGGSPFGPYVNRNNASGYLLICLACAVGLANFVLSKRKNAGPVPIISTEIPVWRQFSQHLLFFISELTAPKIASLIAIFFIAAGVIASISRGGVLALIAGGMLTLLIYGVARRPKNLGVILIPLTVCIIALTTWLGFGEQLFDRWERVDTTEIAKSDARFQNWSDTWSSVSEMGWFGSGLGSYASVHRLYRTNVEEAIFEYAENQYFQALIEGGWLVFFVYVMAWVMAIYYAMFLLKRSQSPATVSVGLTGVFLLTAQGFASAFDYGFYMPANMLGMAVVVGLFAYHAHSIAHRLKGSSWLGYEVPNSVVQTLLVIVFGGLTMACMDLSYTSQVKRLTPTRVLDYSTLDLEATTEKIVSVNKIVDRSPSVKALNQLGKLWVHRARLEYMSQLTDRARQQGGEELSDDSIWEQTYLAVLHDNIQMMEGFSEYSAETYRNNAFIVNNLRPALRAYELSRRKAPVQPRVHLKIAEIRSILHGVEKAKEEFERAVSLAPANPSIRKRSFLYYLQAGMSDEAAPHVKKYLEMRPKEFEEILGMLLGRTALQIKPVNKKFLMESMLPDDPNMLYSFAEDFLDSSEIKDATVRQITLENADDLLAGVSASQREDLILRGKVKIALGEFDDGIEQLELALRSNPSDARTRYILTETLFEQQDFETALEHAGRLKEQSPKNSKYKKILSRVKDEIEKQKAALMNR